MENENQEINKNEITKTNEVLVPIENDYVTEKGTQIHMNTTLQDKKLIFNIENGECDIKLNDVIGQEIIVKDIYMKRIVSKTEEKDIEIDEETGEIINELTNKVVTILIDDNNKKYVTASKIFAMSILNLIRTFGIEDIHQGIKIRIIKKSVSNSNNKALGLELV